LVPAASSAFRIDGMVRLAISSPAEALALPDRCPQGITAHCLDQSYEAEREVAMTAFAKCWRREWTQTMSAFRGWSQPIDATPS